MFLGLTRAILPCLFTVPLSAADCPFVGQWKLNPDRSKLAGQTQTIKDLGGNKYEFNDGTTTYTLVADGTDQPNPSGGTMSLKKERENSWTIVNKRDGRVLSHNQTRITPDGKTRISRVTGTNLNGSTFDDQYTSTRVAGGPGLAGTWERQNVKISSPLDILEITSCDENGVTFVSPAIKFKLDLKFDGKEYALEGPLAPKDLSFTGKRLDPRSFEVTTKHEGKVLSRDEYKISLDGKTLTEIEHTTGQDIPVVLITLDGKMLTEIEHNTGQNTPVLLVFEHP